MSAWCATWIGSNSKEELDRNFTFGSIIVRRVVILMHIIYIAFNSEYCRAKGKQVNLPNI
jgi:hypothetical protein